MTPAEWEFVDWVEAVAEERGYLAGLRDASAAMDTAIENALSGPHGYQANTLDPTAGEVIRRMVKAMTAEATSPPAVTSAQLRTHDLAAMHRGRLHKDTPYPGCPACAFEAVAA